MIKYACIMADGRYVSPKRTFVKSFRGAAWFNEKHHADAATDQLNIVAMGLVRFTTIQKEFDIFGRVVRPKVHK